MKKTAQKPVMSVVQDDAIQERPQIVAPDPKGEIEAQAEVKIESKEETEVTDTPQYEGPVRKMVTKKYEAVPPLQIGVNPSVAGIVSQLEEKNIELTMQIRENKHAIAILKIAEVIRNGERIHTTAEFIANNMIIEVPQPPKPL